MPLHRELQRARYDFSLKDRSKGSFHASDGEGWAGFGPSLFSRRDEVLGWGGERDMEAKTDIRMWCLRGVP